MAKPLTCDDKPGRRKPGRGRREPADVQDAIRRLRQAAYRLTHWRSEPTDPCEQGTAREHEQAAREHAAAAKAARAACRDEEQTAEELDYRLRDAQLRSRLRRLQRRHARHGAHARTTDLSVAQTKARLRRSLERITLRSVELKALAAARERGGPVCLDIIGQYPIPATAVALLAGVAVGAFGLRKIVRNGLPPCASKRSCR